jgi:hypothetical protein
MSRWFYTPDNKQRLGPVTSEELRALAVSGTIRPECMVLPEGVGKWVPASRVKGLFPKPAPAASPPVAQVLVPCPKCGRDIPLQEHELSWTIECARCGAQFVPSQAAAQAPASSLPLDDPALLGLVKGAEPGTHIPHRVPLDAAVATPTVATLVDQYPARRRKVPPWVLVAAILGSILLCCMFVAIVSRDSKKRGGDEGAASGGPGLGSHLPSNEPPLAIRLKLRQPYSRQRFTVIATLADSESLPYSRQRTRLALLAVQVQDRSATSLAGAVRSYEHTNRLEAILRDGKPHRLVVELSHSDMAGEMGVEVIRLLEEH